MNEVVDVDLRALLSRLWAGRLWLGVSVATFAVISILVAFLTEPVYRASVIVAPAGTEQGSGLLGSALGQLGGIAELAGITVGSGGSETDQALAVLRSREFIENFIGREGLLPKLFAREWDSEHAKWIGKNKDGKAPSPARAFRYFKTLMALSQDKKSGLITIQIEWYDPAEAAAWVNALVKHLNEEMQRRAISRADAYLEFLKSELSSAAAIETREAVARLTEAQLKQRMLASVSQDYAFRVVDRAMAPEPDDPAKPNKLLLLALGPLAGLAVGSILVLLLGPMHSGQRSARVPDVP